MDEEILDKLIAFLRSKDPADYKFYEMSDLIKFVEEFKKITSE